MWWVNQFLSLVHWQDAKFAFLIIASETQKEDLSTSKDLNLQYSCSSCFIDSFSVNYVYHCFRIAVLCLSKKFYHLKQLVGNDGVEPSWRHYQCPIIDRYMNCHWKVKMHAIARLYWFRTNVSSIAASALTTKLNVRKVDTVMLFAVMHLWMAEQAGLAPAGDLTTPQRLSKPRSYGFLSTAPDIVPKSVGANHEWGYKVGREDPIRTDGWLITTTEVQAQRNRPLCHFSNKQDTITCSVEQDWNRTN